VDDCDAVSDHTTGVVGGDELVEGAPGPLIHSFQEVVEGSLVGASEAHDDGDDAWRWHLWSSSPACYLDD
jgi:hypothetical protein